MFLCSHHHNHFAKMVTTFLCSQEAPAKTIDLLRAFGLTMSHQWSAQALKTISNNEMLVVQDWVHQFPFVITHDNVNIPFHVLSQCIDRIHHRYTTRYQRQTRIHTHDGSVPAPWVQVWSQVPSLVPIPIPTAGIPMEYEQGGKVKVRATQATAQCA